MTNPNFATDVLAATAPNYKAVSLTKSAAAALVKPPVVSQPKPELEKTVNDSSGNNIELIDLSLLNVDRTYQRSEKKHAKKIAKDGIYDENAVGYPVVNRRPDKSLWVIDGQQRVVALKIRGITHWLCRIVNLKTVREEAELFNLLNGAHGTAAQVSQRDKWRALITAEDPHALACVEAMKAGGLTLCAQRHKRGGDNAWREIDCTGFIMGWAKVNGVENLTRGARIISESWPQSDDCGRYQVMGAVFRMVGDYPNLDDDRAIAKFRLVPAITVEQEAKKAATFKSSGGLPFLLKTYNKGLKSKKLGVKPTDD